MRKILIVVGTRPEAIKMAPLIRRLKADDDFSVFLCSTGQHREMILQVFELFSISPDVDLNLMQPNQTPTEVTARVLTGMDTVLRENRPDRVLVHGDTTTTLAATLASYYHKIPVGHVEAGLRTGNIHAPWPEEANRRLTDAIADKLYAPTSQARENLLREGIAAERILVTGNTVVDALQDVRSGPLHDERTRRALGERFPFFGDGKKVLLITCHRRESFGENFRHICAALAQLADRPDVQIVFPVHLNPNVRAVFAELSGHPRVTLMEPVGYLEFIFLMSECHAILTDSGGIQEEAPSLGKPVFVLRDTTERPEALAAGTVKLVGTDTRRIVETVGELLDSAHVQAAMSKVHQPYGDGKACERIVTSLRGELG
jgi:UDP-N-acetylglucosamine 2-epimerase (non-hydrolysing)